MNWIDLLRRIRHVLIPVGTRRDRAYHGLRLFLLAWRLEGFWVALRRTWLRFARWLRGEGPGGDADILTPTYPEWIQANEPGRRELARQRKAQASLANRPLISLITPVYNPGPDVLADTIHSVLAQTYDRWELCLADGGNDPDVRAVLEDFARKDRRIRVAHLEQNRGIAGNSNAALEMSRGEFVAILDHDDLLAQNMLYEVALALNENPGADIVYFDEDKISDEGRQRRDPWFKPQAFSPDLLLSTNYLMHSVIRKSLIEAEGGFEGDVDGAQDWDMALRLVQKTQNIVPIPKVLYHWRQVEGSAARDANAKPWAYDAQKRALEAHLARDGAEGARVSFPRLGLARVQWPVADARVSVIIPTKNQTGLLRACLESIFDWTEYPDYEVILVDNDSRDTETLAYYEQLNARPNVRIVPFKEPFNYSRANNLGATAATGELLLFLNNDTEALESDWLAEMAGWAARPGVGVVGARLLRPDGTIQHNGIIMGLEGHGSHLYDGGEEHQYGIYGSFDWYRNLQAVTGACMMVPRRVYQELGGMDEAYALGYNDIDLCLRAAEAGYRVVCTPFARMIHHEGGTRGLQVPLPDVLRASVEMLPYVRAGDPFFNPNLSYEHRMPALARRRPEGCEHRLLRIQRDFGLVAPTAGLLIDGSIDPSFEEITAPERSPDGPASAGRRLLIVSHDLSLSGAPIILQELSVFLVEEGFDVTVVSPVPGPLGNEYEAAGIQVIIVRGVLDDARVAYRLLERFDRLLVNTITGFRPILAAAARQKPAAWWIHETKIGRKRAQRERGLAEALRAAPALIFPSKATAGLYEEYLTGDRTHIFPYGMPVKPGRVEELPFQKSPGRMHAVLLASIEPRKGQDVLVKAVQMLPEEVRRGYEFYLVGRILDMPFYNRIARSIRRLGNMRTIGHVSRQEASAYLQAADLVLLASRDEALPLTLLEAMYHGKCILSTDAGGVPEVIDDGVQGLIVPIEDPKALADRLEWLHRDPARAREMGARARERFQAQLTFARFGRAMRKVLENMDHQ